VGYKHPANISQHDNRTFGDRAADAVAEFVGSWRFICIQTAIVVSWIILNLAAVELRWDPYPFILLNLCFSTQAAYAAPILQLATNRQSDHDRERAENDYEVNQEALGLLKDIHGHVTGVDK